MTEAYETEVLGVLANISAGTDRVRSDQYGYDVIRVMVNFGTEARLTINGVEYNLHFVTAEVRIHEDGTTVIGYVSTQGMRRSNWNGDVTHAASDKVRTAVKDLIELLIASGRIELLRKQGDRKTLRSQITRAKVDISKAEKELVEKLAELEQLEAELG